ADRLRVRRRDLVVPGLRRAALSRDLARLLHAQRQRDQPAPVQQRLRRRSRRRDPEHDRSRRRPPRLLARHAL
ncbi:MAG: hypothetical protein AVDCRST_MAG67-194, partial [uncultured Solirubrobacteraceae bacterium]